MCIVTPSWAFCDVLNAAVASPAIISIQWTIIHAAIEVTGDVMPHITREHDWNPRLTIFWAATSFNTPFTSKLSVAGRLN